MKCPECGGVNFNWAAKCDHCGRPLEGKSAAADSLAVGRTPVAGEDAPDNPLRRPESADPPVDISPIEGSDPTVVVATPVLVALNVLAFLAMTAAGISPLTPTADSLIRAGASYGPLMTHGQWWRLLSAMFLHIGVIHLLFNMYVLWSAGRLMERLFGSVAFCVLYLLTGIAGGLASVLWHPVVVSAGASGAIFGLFGGLFGFLFVRRRAVPADVVNALVRYGAGFVIGNIVLGFGRQEIDMSAHLGGLAAGVPIGMALAMDPLATRNARAVRSAAVLIGGLAAAALATRAIPIVDDWAAELKKLAVLDESSQERLAAAVADVEQKKISPADLTKLLNEEITPSWESERVWIQNAHLQPKDRAMADRVAAYMAVRADAWRLMADGIQKNDQEIVHKAVLRGEDAMEALQAALPNKTTADQLAKARAARQADDAFRAELAKAQAIEKSVNTTFANTMNDLMAGRLTPAKGADRLAAGVSRPWKDEWDHLMQIPVPPNRADTASRLFEYMKLKSESYDLWEAGIRSSDPVLMSKARAKGDEAVKVMQGK